MDPLHVEEVLARFEAHLRDIDSLRGLDRYREAVGEQPSGSDVDADEFALLKDSEYLTALAASPAGLSGPTRRRLELHRRRRNDRHVRCDPEVQALVSSLEGSLRAFRRGLSLEDAISPDRARREDAWLLETPLVEAIEPEVTALLHLRNERAREMGCADFAELAYEAAELSRIEWMALCDELEQLTRPLFEEFQEHARGMTGAPTLEAWDLAYALGTGPAASTADTIAGELRDTAARLGFLPEQVPSIAPRSEPGQTRLCVVSIPEDVRIVIGAPHDTAAREDAFRAFGRGLQRRHLETPGAFQWLPPAWDRAAGEILVEAGHPHAKPPHDPRRHAWRTIVALRAHLAESLFEMLAYERPEGDLHSLYSELHEHYLGLPRHPEHLWAGQDFFISRPLRTPKHVVSRLIGAQILGSIGEGVVFEAGTARRLIDDFWKDGALVPWQDRLMQSTGKPLDPEAFLTRAGISTLT